MSYCRLAGERLATAQAERRALLKMMVHSNDLHWDVVGLPLQKASWSSEVAKRTLTAKSQLSLLRTCIAPSAPSQRAPPYKALLAVVYRAQDAAVLAV